MPFDYYTDMHGLILDMKVLERLISKFLPLLSKKFNELNLEPMLFAVQWFVCIFSYNFPSDIVIRIWDIFFVEGLLFVFKVALSILFIYRKEILKITDFNEGISFCGKMAENIDDLDLILETSLKFQVEMAEILETRQSLSCENTACLKINLFCNNEAECKNIKRMTSQYFTFLSAGFIDIIPDHFSGKNSQKFVKISRFPVADENLMVSVQNHYCSKETKKPSLNTFIIKASKKLYCTKIVMPRITLSPYFIYKEITEIK